MEDGGNFVSPSLIEYVSFIQIEQNKDMECNVPFV
jgi:hypothetical protein